MRLRRWSERITEALHAMGIDHALIKGPVFAARLYQNPSDRIFTDVDIVVRVDQMPLAFAALKELGFVSDDIPGRDAAGHCEFKWVLQSDGAVAVELHTNLIHSARLRQRISVDLDTILDAGNGDPAEATALLFVAAVHAASGHQFDRLALLVDIAQASRGLSGTIEVERLRSVCRKSGTSRAVAAALSVTGRMYDQTDCAALAKSMNSGVAPLKSWLVPPSAVLKAQSVSGWQVALRRKIFRQLVTLSTHRPQAAPPTRRPRGPKIGTEPGAHNTCEMLFELGQKHGTDKARHVFLGESYLHIYERYLGPLRTATSLHLLEIGVRGGHSLRMWKEYFPNAQVYGLDIDPDCGRHAESRIEIVTASQNDASALQALAERAGGFDIVVDDASHINHLTCASLEILFPHLNPGGFYIIEDLGMSWVDYAKFADDPHFMEGALKTNLAHGIPIDHHREDLEAAFRRVLYDMDINRGDVEFLHFWSKLAILRKAAMPGRSP